MPDTPNTGIPAPPPGFSPVPDQSAGAIPPPPPGFTPVQQPMVTNSVGETMPADVAARHALTREGKNFNPTDPTVGTSMESTAKIGDFVTNAVMGLGKEGLKTIQGGVSLANSAAKKLDPFDSPTNPTPQLPIPAAAADTETHGFAEGLGGIIEQGLEFMTPDVVFGSLKRIHDVEKLAEGSKVVTGILNNAPQIMKHIAKGAAKGAAVGGAQGAVKGAAEGKAAEGAEGGAIGGAIGGGVGEVLGQVTKAGAEALGISTTAEQDAMRAVKPNKRNFKFSDSFKKAAPILEEQSGGQARTLKDWTSVSKEARDKLWTTEVKPIVDKHASEIMDTQPVADAIRSKITGPMKKYSPKEADKIEAFAKQFDKGVSGTPIGDAEETVEHFNKELRNNGFYRKTADEQAAAMTDGDTAARVAAVESMRDQLYTHLEKAGETNIRELKANYGALRNFENEVRGQVNVVGRQAAISLKQMMGMTAGAIKGGPAGAAAASIPVVDKILNEPGRVLTKGIKKAANEAAGKGPALTTKAVSAVEENAGKVGGFTGAQAGQMVSFTGSDGRKYQAPAEAWDKIQKADPGAQQTSQ